MVFFVWVLCSLAHSSKVQELTNDLLRTSSKNDYDGNYNCKRPSVKAMVGLWEIYPNQCLVPNKHSYISIKSDRFQFERGTEVRLEFVRIWKHYLRENQFTDSWMPRSGTGTNDKGGTQEMFFNNIDSTYLMGEKDQLNTTFAIVENKLLNIEGNFSTYDFITKHIGSLISAYYLTSNPLLKLKALQYGEWIFEFYKDWVPYTTYNFKSKKGEFGKIEIKQLVNVAELYILSRLSKDERYEKLIGRIVDQLKEISHFQVLPQHAYLEDGVKLKYAGWLSSNSESADVQRVLWNSWRLSNRKDEVFKTLLDINKKAILTLLPFSSKDGSVIMIERTPKTVEYRMDLKMCGWAGVLAEENRNIMNSSEVNLAVKLMNTCLRVFTDLNPSNLLYLNEEKVETRDSLFSLPGEIAESLFFLYRATGEHWIRKAGLHMFRVIKKNYGKEFGYVFTGSEVMPSDFLSKTLKYLFLLQASPSLFLGAYFSTAGHLLASK